LSEHYEPRPWQRIMTKAMIENNRYMIVADPGMGKTAATLAMLDCLKLGGSNWFPALVIAPKRVAAVVWDGERDKWKEFHGLSMIKIMGEKEERLAALRQPTADIYVVNYDLIPWLTEVLPGEKWPFKIVIADESSRLKGFRLNRGGVRAKALSQIARFTGRWINLTGTPCPNGLQDLYGQMWFCDFGERLKRTYSAFLEAFFIQNEYTRKITTQFGADTEIHRLVADRLLVLRAEDWLSLEKPQLIPVEVELSPKVLEQCRAMSTEFFLALSDAEIEAGTAAVKSLKLLQMASGAVYDGDTVSHDIHDAKIEGLQDIVEQIGKGPLLVGTWWKFSIPKILKAFPQARIYAGKKDEDDWNAGKIKMLLLHEQSAFGLNLHGPCRDVCFYDHYWSSELRQQFIERVGPTRQAQAGLKRVVRVWDIIAKGTIDRDVIDSNERKITIEQALKRARARSGV
jgi:SNF2 family DNA or RNA helicase